MNTTLTVLFSMARPILINLLFLIYLIGALIARSIGTPIDAEKFILGFIPLFFVALSAHYINEYADVETDTLTEPTLFSGGSGIAKRGLAAPKLALKAALVTLGLSILFAIIALSRDVLNIDSLAVFIFGGTVAWLYSLPPFKLAWRGWGEFINAILAGINLPLYGFAVQTGRLDQDVIIGCVPFALLIFVMILTTNWSDREADTRVGKFTLTTRLSPRQLRRTYALATIVSFAILPILYESVLPAEVVLSSLPAIPALIWAWTKYTHIKSPYPTAAALVMLVPLQLIAWIIVGS